MKGIILLNGEPYEGEMEKGDALVYCCDGAYLWAKDKIVIDENIGDFDSLDVTPYPLPKEIYPEEKDDTDAEIALNRMIAKGVDDVTFYGAGGKREDHFFGNIHLMYSAFLQGVACRMETNFSTMFFVQGEVKLFGVKGKTISLVPFCKDVRVKNSKGLHYPLKDLVIPMGKSLGISNKADEDEVSFNATDGTLLVFIDRKKKGEEGG